MVQINCSTRYNSNDCEPQGDDACVWLNSNIQGHASPICTCIEVLNNGVTGENYINQCWIFRSSECG